jgi:hypothetical protein
MMIIAAVRDASRSFGAPGPAFVLTFVLICRPYAG